jgi:hypothetical protein
VKAEGSNTNTLFLIPESPMTVLLINKRTEAEKLIQIPPCPSFAAFVAAVRSVEPNRHWEVFESF